MPAVRGIGALACRFYGYRFAARDSDQRRLPGRIRLAVLGGAAAISVVAAVVGYTALVGLPLSDAERLWCEQQALEVGRQAEGLGLPKPRYFDSWEEWGLLVETGFLAASWDNPATTHPDDRRHRDRACRAAYQLR